MPVLHLFDSGDYDPAADSVVREAVRGIIQRDGAFVLVRSDKFGEYKFPGGGVERGESHGDTLAREVREETGLTVIPSSIRFYGKTIERRRDAFGEGVFEQHSYYYRCDVTDTIGETRLDAYEAEYGYRLATVPIGEAITANRVRTGDRVNIPWVARDLFVMEGLEDEGE